MTYFAWNDVSEVASPKIEDTTIALHIHELNIFS